MTDQTPAACMVGYCPRCQQTRHAGDACPLAPPVPDPPADAAAIRARHVIDASLLRLVGRQGCVQCLAPWPCDTIRVLDALAAAEQARDAQYRHTQYVAGQYKGAVQRAERAERVGVLLAKAGWAVLPFVNPTDGEAAACARAQLEEALAEVIAPRSTEAPDGN